MGVMPSAVRAARIESSSRMTRGGRRRRGCWRSGGAVIEAVDELNDCEPSSADADLVMFSGTGTAPLIV